MGDGVRFPSFLSLFAYLALLPIIGFAVKQKSSSALQLFQLPNQHIGHRLKLLRTHTSRRQHPPSIFTLEFDINRDVSRRTLGVVIRFRINNDFKSHKILFVDLPVHKLCGPP